MCKLRDLTQTVLQHLCFADSGKLSKALDNTFPVIPTLQEYQIVYPLDLNNFPLSFFNICHCCRQWKDQDNDACCLLLEPLQYSTEDSWSNKDSLSKIPKDFPYSNGAGELHSTIGGRDNMFFLLTSSLTITVIGWSRNTSKNVTVLVWGHSREGCFIVTVIFFYVLLWWKLKSHGVGNSFLHEVWIELISWTLCGH